MVYFVSFPKVTTGFEPINYRGVTEEATIRELMGVIVDVTDGISVGNGGR
jgi:hypothetical protein